MFHENGRYKYPAEFAPEFAGDVSVVNGKAWPTFVVQPRQYRFRLLNGSNGRFFDISLENENDGEVPTIYQIGTDLGFLQDVVPIGSDRIPPPCFSGRPNGRTSSSTSQSTPAIRSP